MATKTISIDEEAYKRLKCIQKSNESFSQTIKRVIRPPLSVDQWLKKIDGRQMGRTSITAVEKQVAQRRRSSRRER